MLGIYRSPDTSAHPYHDDALMGDSSCISVWDYGVMSYSCSEVQGLPSIMSIQKLARDVYTGE